MTKRGKWEWKKVYFDSIPTMAYVCSECNNSFIDLEGWNYCPNCGAKMIDDEPKGEKMTQPYIKIDYTCLYCEHHNQQEDDTCETCRHHYMSKYQER